MNFTTIIDLLEKTAELYPDSCAIEGQVNSWNYSDLEKSGNQIAHYINNIASQENVVICLDRSDWTIIAIVGILKSGNTYVPIDSSTPQVRIDKIVEITKPKLIITDENNLSKFKNDQNVIPIDQIKSALSKLPNSPLSINISEDEIAYIIFTSGTTGMPKGIPILHRSLFNKISRFNPKLNFNPSHNFILLASIAFDASIGQIFLPLTNGSTLHIINKEEQNNPILFWDYIIKKKINILYTIPSLLNALLESPLNLKGISFDYILLGAELFPSTLLSKIRAKLTVNKIVNMYGPTESTVNAIMHIMSGKDNTVPNPIPIGSALPGYEIFILDKNKNRVEDGNEGEIAIAGLGLSPGYFNDPSLTNVKFLSKGKSKTDKRIFLTGDYGRRNAENYYEFLGRKDSQIKINGYRIELLEIEMVIKDITKVKNCSVELNPSNKNQIIAFVEFISNDSRDDSDEMLKTHLKTILPYYMIPNKIIQVKDFPMLLSGKQDKLKLLSLLENNVTLSTQKSAITTSIERKIIEAWKEIFEIQQVTVDDNFINLGGGSIQSILLVNKLLKRGIRIEPIDVYLHPTVTELANVANEVEPENPTAMNDEAQIPNEPLSIETKKTEDKNPPKNRIRIESMGAYIPENFVTTKEVMAGCVNEITFPIERFTGIKSRPVASSDESSFEIGQKAIADCMNNSKLGADDIDLLICCNTVRSLGSKCGLFDPSFALMYKKKFNFQNAISFDVNNACAGMFTVIEIADVMMKNGTIKNTLIVSGEHNTPVIRSAQLELVNDKFDNRLACLTVGDAGVAITLDQTADGNGFEYIKMLTMGELNDLCIGKIERVGHGGPIMYNDSVKAAAAGITPGIEHVFHTLKSKNWSLNSVDHFIMHQTSLTTIQNSMREINIQAGEEIVSEKNVVINLENRGNTGASCQFLALYDNIMNKRIKSNCKIVFPINGSGRVLGTALFKMDDLPDKMNSPNKHNRIENKTINNDVDPLRYGVKIEAMSVYYPRESSESTTKIMNKKAVLKCLAESDLEKNDLELIIYSGVIRDDFITEPALAATIAGDLKINVSGYNPDGQSTFCFDVLNGNIGTFNAIQIASEYIRTGKTKNALVVASEIDYNKDNDHPRASPNEMGSALLLSRDDSTNSGMGKFVNHSSPSHPIEKKVYADSLNSETFLNKETLYTTSDNQIISAITKCIKGTLDKNKIEVENVDTVVLSGVQGILLDEISKNVGVDINTFYVPEKNDEDLGSSSIIYRLNQYVNRMSGYKQKTILIIIEFGDGLTTGGVSYVF